MGDCKIELNFFELDDIDIIVKLLKINIDEIEEDLNWYKGLDSKNLIITEMKADQGPQQWHQGRMRRRKMKNTHLSIKVMEKEE